MKCYNAQICSISTHIRHRKNHNGHVHIKQLFLWISLQMKLSYYYSFTKIGINNSDQYWLRTVASGNGQWHMQYSKGNSSIINVPDSGIITPHYIYSCKHNDPCLIPQLINDDIPLIFRLHLIVTHERICLYHV